MQEKLENSQFLYVKIFRPDSNPHIRKVKLHTSGPLCIIFRDYHYLFDHCALEISRTELASGGSQDQQLADRNDKGNHTKYEHWYQGPSSLLRVAFQTHVSKQGDFFMDLVIFGLISLPFFLVSLEEHHRYKGDDRILHGLITNLEF